MSGQEKFEKVRKKKKKNRPKAWLEARRPVINLPKCRNPAGVR